MIEVPTLADLIATDWISDLERLREHGWMVAAHNDYTLNGTRMTFWLFTHGSGRYVKGEGSSDAVAVYQAFCAAGVAGPVAFACSHCNGPLRGYDTGLACDRCKLYLEKGILWRLYCDENHGHGYRCLVAAETT